MMGSTPHNQSRELSAFARFRIIRIERDPAQPEAWVVNIALMVSGYASEIAISDRGEVFEERGVGQDGTLATWDAMCRVEERLRERR